MEGGTPGRAQTKTQGTVGAAPPFPPGFSLENVDSSPALLSPPPQSLQNACLLPLTGHESVEKELGSNSNSATYLRGWSFSHWKSQVPTSEKWSLVFLLWKGHTRRGTRET